MSTPTTPTEIVIGVDVGTGSARAGIFTLDGTSLASAVRPIQTWRPQPDFAQQSSDDIWNAVCQAVRAAMTTLSPHHIVRGIGFDATCSLVVLDHNFAPLTVDPNGDPAQNIILWADHRAQSQADTINQTAHKVLNYVGGRISLEMQTPKLLWLKQHAPETWQRAAHFFDLPDYLTFRATNSTSRSLCSLVCKWTYLAHETGWDESYFRAIGLADLACENFTRIGTEILPIGTPIANGLTTEAAAALDLPPGTPVGTSAIDAHAGGIGIIGATLPDTTLPNTTQTSFNHRIALIGGTSSCHMAVSTEAAFVPGIWGPYFSAMVPSLWLNEGGQSATGALIDHIVTTHAAFPDLAAKATETGITIYEFLNLILDDLTTTEPPARLTANLHVLPDFNGNRSPRADATLRGSITGLTLSATAYDLARLYLATIQAIAYGTRAIIETMNQNGYAIDTIFATGGGTKNRVFLREHADATGCRLILPAEPEAVLLGAAILGAVAGQAHPDLRTAMAAMSRTGSTITPNPATRADHDRKYIVFKRLQSDQLEYRSIMSVR